MVLQRIVPSIVTQFFAVLIVTWSMGNYIFELHTLKNIYTVLESV